jgi:hypothetical protein
MRAESTSSAPLAATATARHEGVRYVNLHRLAAKFGQLKSSIRSKAAPE